VVVVPHANGVVLLERDGARPTPFSWKSATVYFLLTDRFFNGDPGNDHSYGRRGDGADEVGTWHGGDWAGVTAKLDYLAGLGVDALWLSPIVEQVHGWVGGGSGDFKNYGYAGYWAADFTRLDANLGTQAELSALIEAAHARGIRVLVDVVLNHPGYATGADLLAWNPGVFNDRTGAAFETFDRTFVYDGGTGTYFGWNDLVNFRSPDWCAWWGPTWIRAGLGPNTVGCTFAPGGPTSDPFTASLSYLPDFKTESTVVADVPAFFAQKSDTGFTADLGLTPRQYMVRWHADWVRALGFDGFRVDTVNNVEPEAFAALKTAASSAFEDWKAAHPARTLDATPFFTVAEAFGHGVELDAIYATGHFDAVLNFTFQQQLRDLLNYSGGLLGDGAATLSQAYAQLGATTADPAWGVLSYLSSHDTDLFFALMGGQPRFQRQGGTALLLAPGGVQLFYGDESARPRGPTASDPAAGARSDMNWASPDPTVLAHFRLLGNFRKKHGAVGAGTHTVLPSPAGTWAFSRTLKRAGLDDAVVVLLTPPR
jgi:alpha-amylase